MGQQHSKIEHWESLGDQFRVLEGQTDRPWSTVYLYNKP